LEIVWRMVWVLINYLEVIFAKQGFSKLALAPPGPPEKNSCEELFGVVLDFRAVFLHHLNLKIIKFLQIKIIQHSN
jgi:hypothetical protein